MRFIILKLGFLAISMLAIAASFPERAQAQAASAYVEISDRAYRDIEKLAAFGLCIPPMIDQRPFLRGEFARMIKEAKEKFDALPKEESQGDGFEVFSKSLSRRRSMERILKRLSTQFHDELADNGAIGGEKPFIRGHPFELLRLDGIYAGEAPLQILEYNGLANLQANVEPFMDYREGRHQVFGFQEAVETLHRLAIGRHLALLARPRLEANIWQGDGDSTLKILLQEGYAVTQFGDATLTLGRSSVVWGPGEHGAYLLTNNARPLDLIQLSTPSPFRLPWVFKHMGDWRLTLFGANLGPEQARKYAWLTGYRLSYRPTKYLELGFGNTTMMGGDGAPSLSVAEIIGEFLGFRLAGTAPNSVNKTNHLMEAVAIVRVPQVWGLELYGVLNNEDKRDTLKRFLRDGSSYTAGVYLPAIGNTGSQSARIEFKRTSPLLYRHSLYPNGYTLNNLIIGDDLGPDALGLHASYDYDFSDSLSLCGAFDWELRRGDMHTITIDPDGTLGDTIVSQGGPHENRYRFVVEPSFKIRPNLKLQALAGYERVINAGYAEGITRNNWLAALSIRIDVDNHFRFER